MGERAIQVGAEGAGEVGGGGVKGDNEIDEGHDGGVGEIVVNRMRFAPLAW